MSNIKFFRLTNDHATELRGSASDLEKPLQALTEANLGPLLNIRFPASEHSTGNAHQQGHAWGDMAILCPDIKTRDLCAQVLAQRKLSVQNRSAPATLTPAATRSRS